MATERSTRPSAQPAGQTSAAGPTRGPVRIGLLLGAFLAPSALGMSAAPVALPALGWSLRLNPGATAWVLAAYTLTLSISTALSGRMADLRGPRTPLVGGMALLVAGSALIMVGPSFPLVVAGRLIQGAGAGTAAVLAFAIAAQACPDAADRGRAMGTMGAIVGLVSGAGALLGGALTDTVGWRGALALPVLSAVVAGFVGRMVPARSGTGQGRLDSRGALLCLALVAAVAVLLQAPATGIAGPITVLVAVVAVAAAIGITLHVRHRPDGFLPRQLVSTRVFVLAAAAGFTLFAGYLIIQFAAPRLILAEHHLTATPIGLIFLPTGLCSAVLSNLGGRLAGRIPPLRIVTVLAVASVAALILAAVAGLSPVPLVFAVAAAVSAFSTGQVALMAAIPQLVDPAHRGIASGVFQLVFITGGSVGSALVGGLAEVMPLRVVLAVLAVVPLAGIAASIAARRAERAVLSAS